MGKRHGRHRKILEHKDDEYGSVKLEKDREHKKNIDNNKNRNTSQTQTATT